ncbi:MAG: VWA domain-containing protein [Clostridia bacterium]|nr:VWA domain-containing protein [Clostridia bacterium]
MNCPKCGGEIPEGTKKCPLCSAKVKLKAKKEKTKPALPKLWISVLSLVLAFVMLATSSTFALFTEGHTQEKADDSVVDGKIKTETSSKTEYELDKIEKPDADTSEVDSLPSDKTWARDAADEILTVERAIDTAIAEVEAEHSEVTIDTVSDYISAAGGAARELYYDDVIDDYETNAECVVIELSSGGNYVYAPAISDYDAGAPELSVASYQPFIGSGHYDTLSSYASYPDDAAKLIASTFPLYKFDSASGDYNDGEVNTTALMQMSEHNVLLWHGHGCYSYNYGSLMSLNIPRSEANDAAFSTLIKNGELLMTSSRYLVSAKFFDNRIPDNAFDNAVVYLGTCSAGKNNRLANAFLNKGAEAVYAPDDTVYTKYNVQMLYAISEGLCKQHDDGTYYNVEEALEYAKKQHGDTDGGKCNTEIALFTNNPTFTLDWYTDYVVSERDVVLVLDVSGSMAGTALNETKNAAVEFVNTVLDENARIGIVSYASNANIVSDFSTKKQHLITSIERLGSGGSTDIDVALQTAERMLETSKAKRKIIVLMSDGVPNESRVGDELVEYADTIKDKDIYIYTLGFFHQLYSYEKAQAQDLMGRIASDGHHYEVENADDLVFFFGDMADTISGQKYIYIEIACPVNVTVTKNGETLSSDADSLSTRTSFGTLSFEENVDENGDPVYTSDEDDEDAEPVDNRKKILRLKDGMEYDIEIEGTADGEMNYTVQYMDEEGNYSDKREFRNIEVTEDMQATSVASSKRGTTILNVDSDGDGRFDIIYEAAANEKAKEVENILMIVLLWICGIALAWMFGSVIAIVVQTLRRQKAKCNLAMA